MPKRWQDRLGRSGYFFAALLFHLILFLLVATWVVFRPPPPPTDDFAKTFVPAGRPPPPPPATTTPTMAVTTEVQNNPTVITVPTAAPSFNVPLPQLNPATLITKLVQKISPPSQSHSNNLSARLAGIMQTETQWGRTRENIANTNGDPHNVIAKFPVYLASYADGDWGCNVRLDESGQITAGSLPDLVAKMNEWSRGNIKGEVVPTPLEIGGPDLMAKRPPFIFFTGHKDFVLTDAEIENLRNYLQNGGAIWGDNALPGYGSRFDVAFRREMKRVVPDADKNFEPVPMSDDIFTKSWFNITKLPTGMNFYAEPIQHLDIDGKLAIIYTPNDYSDLMFMKILPGDTEMADQWIPEKGSPLFTSGAFWFNSNVFFRNFTLPSSLAAHHLGMNIIGFLLVRFDKDLLLAP